MIVSWIIRWPVNFFILNKVIDFLEYIKTFSFFLTFLKFFEILKNDCNVSNFGYVFVPRFHNVQEFFGLLTCTVIASIVLSETVFWKMNKNRKNSRGL